MLPTGTPVAKIQDGDRFRHWRYGPVIVVYRRSATTCDGKPLIQLGLSAEIGEIPDDWRPNAKIHLLED